MSKRSLTQNEKDFNNFADFVSAVGVTLRTGELRPPKARKDLRDRQPIYRNPVFGSGPYPSTNGHSTLSTNGVRRNGFRRGHLPSLDVYDNRRDMGIGTAVSLASLLELAESMDEGLPFGSDFAEMQHRFESRDLRN